MNDEEKKKTASGDLPEERIDDGIFYLNEKIADMERRRERASRLRELVDRMQQDIKQMRRYEAARVLIMTWVAIIALAICFVILHWTQESPAPPALPAAMHRDLILEDEVARQKQEIRQARAQIESLKQQIYIMQQRQ